MHKILLVVAFGCPSFAALAAEQSAPSVQQRYVNVQTIRQTMSGVRMEAPPVEDLTALTTTSAITTLLQQQGNNMSNVLTSRGDFGSVTQRFEGQQYVYNDIVSGAFDTLQSIDQTGSNLTGVIQGNTIELAVQFMGADAVQSVANSADLAGTFDTITQTGANTANLAIAQYSIGTGQQDLVAGAVQRIDNTLTLAAGAVVSGLVSQSGTNIGNMMLSDRVDEVTRLFAGTQIVNNTIQLADTSVPQISQNGVNIANFLSSNKIGTIKQISVGQQIVNNVVLGPNGEVVNNPAVTQDTANIVNFTYLGPLPASEASQPQDVTVEQVAEFDQTSQGSSGSSQTGNSLTIQR
jgi:hypothetical protein